MDQNQMNQGEQTGDNVNAAPQPTPEPNMNTGGGDEKKSMGPVVGIIIIIILIVLGGWYYWSTQIQGEMTPEEIIAGEDVALLDLQEQGTSDEVADIEADLDATDLEGLDAELEQIDNELNF